MANFLLVVVAVLVATAISGSRGQRRCERRRHVYADQSGDVVIVGVYELHQGHMCDVMRSSAVRLVHGAQWAVDTINKLQIVPNVTIGEYGCHFKPF